MKIERFLNWYSLVQFEYILQTGRVFPTPICLNEKGLGEPNLEGAFLVKVCMEMFEEKLSVMDCVLALIEVGVLKR